MELVSTHAHGGMYTPTLGNRWGSDLPCSRCWAFKFDLRLCVDLSFLLSSFFSFSCTILFAYVCAHAYVAVERATGHLAVVSARCVWHTACSSLGQILSVIQAQSVIGTWIWANNNNVILTASQRGYYSKWHNIISSALVAFITQFSFSMMFGDDSTVVGQWRELLFLD